MRGQNRRPALLVLVLLAGTAGLAQADPYTVTSKECMAVPGGLMWAVQQANAHPGRDRIDIAVNFIAVGRHAGDVPGGCVNPRPTEPWAFTVTDSVDGARSTGAHGSARTARARGWASG